MKLISAVVPVFNSARYIEEAVQSIRNQTWPVDEIILVNDGSTDDSFEMIKKMPSPVRVIDQNNQGAAAARNRGVQATQGAFLAFLDADDLWMPTKIESQFRFLEAHGDIDMVFGHVEQFHSPEFEDRSSLPEIRNAVLPGIVHQAMLIRRESYLKVGDLDESLRIGEFLNWYAKAQSLGLRGHVLPEIVVRRRIHDDNLSSREKRASGDYFRALKANLSLKRARGGIR